MENIFYLYLAFSGIVSFLIFGIVYRSLPVPMTYSGSRVYVGKRAILLSIGMLFLWILVVPLMIKNETGVFNIIIFFQSSIFGIPIGFGIHRGLSALFKFLGLPVLHRTKPRKIIVANLLLWGIVGIFVGMLTLAIAYSITGSILIGFLTAIVSLSFTSWLGARTYWES